MLYVYFIHICIYNTGTWLAKKYFISYNIITINIHIYFPSQNLIESKDIMIYYSQNEKKEIHICSHIARKYSDIEKKKKKNSYLAKISS